MLPVSGEQHQKAREAAFFSVVGYLFNDKPSVRARAVDAVLAAYHASLAAQGVRLVVETGELDSLCGELAGLLGPGKPPKGVTRAAYWISRVAEALPPNDGVRLVDAREVAEWLEENVREGVGTALHFFARFGGGDG